MKQLSGGQLRRVELVKALISQPQILLLDEPTTGLDPVARRDFWEQIAQLKNDSISVVLSTHLMDEAQNFENVAIFSEGKILANGSPEMLCQNFAKERLILKFSDTKENFADDLKKMIDGKSLDLSYEDSHSSHVIRGLGLKKLMQDLTEQFGDRLVHLSFDEASLSDVYFALAGEDLERA